MDAAGAGVGIYAGVILSYDFRCRGRAGLYPSGAGLSHRHWRRFSAGYLQSDRYIISNNPEFADVRGLEGNIADP